MPVHFLTEADHESLNRFPEEIAREDLFNFFWLSSGDRQLVDKQRNDSNCKGLRFTTLCIALSGFYTEEPFGYPFSGC